MQDYVGIYWTRPVPWAGFVELDPDVETAARQSRTIRYQRELVRRFVQRERGRLVGEHALLELAPDRATPESLSGLRSVLDRSCPTLAFVFVDFAAAHGWRQHRHLAAAVADRRHVALYPDPLETEDFRFDPVAHFRAWREIEQRHAGDKTRHRAQVLAALAEMEGASRATMAANLNALGLRTHSGKAWSADNLRKFLRRGIEPAGFPGPSDLDGIPPRK